MVKGLARAGAVAVGITIIALTIGAPPGSAQSRRVTADWESVKQLTAGATVRVALSGKVTVQGRFQSATDDSVAVSSNKGQETVARQSVVRLSVKREGYRSRNVLIGLGIGAGVGVVAGAVADAHCIAGNCLLKETRNTGKLAFALVGGILGAGVGAVLPTGWRDIYRA